MNDSNFGAIPSTAIQVQRRGTKPRSTAVNSLWRRGDRQREHPAGLSAAEENTQRSLQIKGEGQGDIFLFEDVIVLQRKEHFSAARLDEASTESYHKSLHFSF
jgi:hypothetical protein